MINIYKLKSEPKFINKGRTPMGDFDVFKADFFNSINFGYEFFKEHLITIDTKNKLIQINLLKGE